MGDHPERPGAVNLCPFVGVDRNLWLDRLYSRHRAGTDVNESHQHLTLYWANNYLSATVQCQQVFILPIIFAMDDGCWRVENPSTVLNTYKLYKVHVYNVRWYLELMFLNGSRLNVAMLEQSIILFVIIFQPVGITLLDPKFNRWNKGTRLSVVNVDPDPIVCDVCGHRSRIRILRILKFIINHEF